MEEKIKVDGAIWDSILTDEEEESGVYFMPLPIEPLPEVPPELLDRTLDACKSVIDFEIRCNADPSEIPPRRMNEMNIFQRIFWRFKKALKRKA